MKRRMTKGIGFVLAIICAFSAVGAASAVCASAAAADTNTKAAADDSAEPEKPTIDLESGIYPMDGSHYLLVHEDHTFEVVNCEEPDQSPQFTPA